GLNFIAQKADPARLGEEKRIATDYVIAIKKIVSVVRRILRRCIYLDPGLSSTNVWYPTEEGAWFEKVLFPHRPAMFVHTATAGVALRSFGTAARTAIENLQVQANQINNGVAAGIRVANLNFGTETPAEIY